LYGVFTTDGSDCGSVELQNATVEQIGERIKILEQEIFKMSEHVTKQASQKTPSGSPVDFCKGVISGMEAEKASLERIAGDQG